MGGGGGVADFIFLGSRITADGNCSHEIKRHLLLGRKAMTNLDSILRSRGITLLTKVCIAESYGFSSSQVWIWELDHKESWVLKNWCFQTMVLEKTLESPLDCRRSNHSVLKEISPEYHWKDWCWSSNILWPPDAKNWLIRKDPDAGKDWRREEKGMTKDEMVGWHHQFNGHESE